MAHISNNIMRGIHQTPTEFLDEIFDIIGAVSAWGACHGNQHIYDKMVAATVEYADARYKSGFASAKELFTKAVWELKDERE